MQKKFDSKIQEKLENFFNDNKSLIKSEYGHSSPVRILHCIHSLTGGGAEKQLSLLCRDGHKYHLENSTFCVDEGDYSQPTNRTLVRYHRKSKADIGIFRAIANAIDDVKPDVIHAWLPPVITIPALLVGWWKNVPVIVSYRNAKRFRVKLDLLEYIFSGMVASGIASNTNVELCSLPYQWLFSWKNGILIRNGVSVPLNQAQSDDRNFLKSGKLSILFAGRLTRQKNWKCLLDALVIVGDEISWSLSVCGKGEDEKQIEEYLISENLHSKVKMLGFKSDLYTVMEDSDLLVLPSWYEGMPNVLVESLKIGLPCILSDIPAHKDIVGSVVPEMFFPPDKPDVLAEKIIDLCQNISLLKEMAIRGKSIAENYTVEKMICRYAGFYRRIGKLVRSNAIVSL